VDRANPAEYAHRRSRRSKRSRRSPSRSPRSSTRPPRRPGAVHLPVDRVTTGAREARSWRCAGPPWTCGSPRWSWIRTTSCAEGNRSSRRRRRRGAAAVLDTVTVALLTDFRAAREAALEPAHLTLAPDAFLFSPDPHAATRGTRTTSPTPSASWPVRSCRQAAEELAPLQRHPAARRRRRPADDAGRLGHSDAARRPCGSTRAGPGPRTAKPRAVRRPHGRPSAKGSAEEAPAVESRGCCARRPPAGAPQRPVDESCPWPARKDVHDVAAASEAPSRPAGSTR